MLEWKEEPIDGWYSARWSGKGDWFAEITPGSWKIEGSCVGYFAYFGKRFNRRQDPDELKEIVEKLVREHNLN